ncbi:MAG: hypothetical protein QXV12_01855 [Candidatus Rehaiarchaeum fermentans]|nr:hypothetical protein [Candidatus Rehaiarchaeum fermentans]
MAFFEMFLVFSGILLIISGLYSFFITRGFYALIKHKFGREISLTWGINLNERIKEVYYVSVGTILFAVVFLVDILSISVGANFASIDLTLGTISYTIIGYVLTKWARSIEKI